MVFALVLATWFYWHEYRPSSIRKQCYKEAKEREEYEENQCMLKDPKSLCLTFAIAYYKECLIKNGIRPDKNEKW